VILLPPSDKSIAIFNDDDDNYDNNINNNNYRVHNSLPLVLSLR
jgi:hypothetical protein